MSQKSKSKNTDLIKVDAKEIKRIERDSTFSGNAYYKKSPWELTLEGLKVVGPIVGPSILGFFKDVHDDKREEKKFKLNGKNQVLDLLLQHLDKELAKEVHDQEKIARLIEQIEKLT